MKKKDSEIVSMIGSDVSFSGEISFTGELINGGKIKGKVVGDSFTQETSADFDGEAVLKILTTNGKVSGKIETGHLELKNSSKTKAEIKASSIIVSDGAVFDVNMHNKK